MPTDSYGYDRPQNRRERDVVTVSKLVLGILIGMTLFAPSRGWGNTPEGSDPLPPEALASQVARLFQDEPLGQPWMKWVAASGARSIPYTGEATNLSTVDYWVFRAGRPYVGGQVERVGYLIGDSATPTLEYTSWTLTRGASDSLAVFDSIWVALNRRLSATFRRVPTSDNPVFRGGSAFQKNASEYAGARGELRAYRSSFGYPGAPESIVIKYWSHGLLADAAASPAAPGMIEFSWDDTTIVLPSERDARRALAQGHRALEASLVKRPTSPEDLPVVLEALQQAGRMHSEEADLLRYASHLWARDLPDAVKEEVGRQLTPYLGMPLEFCQNDSLIYRLAARAGENRWTDAAFLELMDLGWGCLYCDGESDVCEGMDTSAPVIEHGEEFLSAHSRSPIGSEVAWRVAMAHETAWTLWVCRRGIPPTPEQVAQKPHVRSEFDMTGPKNRDRAIELYTMLIRQDPTSVRSRAASRRIPRMRLDVATDYRRYWCFQD